MKNSILAIIILLSLNGISQPAIEFRKYKELAPKVDLVSPEYHIGINLSLQDDKIKIEYTKYEEFLYLGDEVKEYSERSIYSSSFCKLEEVEAFTLVPDDKKYNKVAVEKFIRNTIIQDNVFHDDNEELLFNLLQVEKGSKSVISSSFQITDPHFLPVFYLSPYLHYFNATFTLTCPDDIEIVIDTMNMASVQISYKSSKKGNKNIMQWKIIAANPLKYENDGPGADYFAPQIIPRIRYYYANNTKTDVLDNLENLHKWYSNFITLSEEDTVPFKSLTDSLVSGCGSNLEKATKLYNWVQKNISYIAFEDGYAGYIPEKASKVYENRYGDCKGLANLLYNMLKAQNIQSYLCWVGTNKLPYKYSKIPSTMVDNHMIVALTADDSLLFLDPTLSNLPFGMPSPNIQGKETLVNIHSYDQYKLVTIPVIDGEQNQFYDSCSITIEGQNLIGKGLAVLSGYFRMDFMDGLNLNDYKSVLNFSRSNLVKGNNNFVLDTVWFTNIEDKNNPLYIWYNFRVPDYIISSEGENYINLNLDKISLPSAINKNRKLPFVYPYQKSEINIVTLNLDDQVKSVLLPSDMIITDESCTFENTYARSNNQLRRYEKCKQDLLQLNPGKFESFNQLLEKIIKNYQQLVIIN